MNTMFIAASMIKRLVRGHKTWLLHLFGPPIVVALLLGSLSTQIKGSVIVDIANLDRGELGGMLVQALRDEPAFLVREKRDRSELRESVIAEKTNAAIAIPADYSERLLSGRDAVVEHVGFRESDVADLALEAIDRKLERTARAIAQLRAAGVPEADLPAALLRLNDAERERHIEAEKLTVAGGGTETVFIVFGFMLMFMMMLMNRMVVIIAEDGRQHTIVRLHAAPVRTIEIALGYFLGSFAIGTIQVLVVMATATVIFPYAFSGIWSSFLVLECFLLAALGFASAFAGITAVRQRNPVMMAILMPTCMLGGCFWPVKLMPPFMQKLSHAVPQSWAIDALTQIAGGASLADVKLHLAVLVLFAAVLLTFGLNVVKPPEKAQK